MKNQLPLRKLCLGLALFFGAATFGYTQVVFENPGVKQGWSNYPQTVKYNGTLTEVSSPTYKGKSALRFYQIYGRAGVGYHNEVVKTPCAPVNTGDYFFSFAIYLPSNFIFHDQSVCISQWSRSDKSDTPWTLLVIEQNVIRSGGSGGLRKVWGTIEKGKWTTVVVQIKNTTKTDGIFKVWVNGKSTGEFKGKITPGGPSLRWSSGQYCTGWREHKPAGNNPMITYMDHFRIAKTYAQADPTKWTSSTGKSAAEEAEVAEVSEPEIVVSPNPVSNGLVNVELNGLVGTSTIKVFNLSGQLVKEKTVTDEQSVQLQLDNVKGMCLLQIVNGTKVITKKIALD